MARPKKTLTDLPKGWEKTIEKMMSEGAGRDEVTAELGISNDLFTRFFKEEKEFSEAIKRGVEKCYAWWLKQGRVNLQNRQFNYVGWYMNMKNRFQWRDKIDTDITSGGKPIPILQVLSKGKGGLSTESTS